LNAWYSSLSPKASSTIIFVGTYTGDGPNDSKGIYAFSFNDTTSTLTPLGLAVATPNPSYILIHPTHKYLYAVNEQDDGKINAFKINSTQQGHLTLINQQSSRGGSPCYLSTNRAGRYIFVANYNNGTVAVLPIDENDGSLKRYSGFDQQIGSSIDSNRQQSSHAHCILLDKIEENVLSANLGSDQIYTYRFFPNNGSLLRLTVTKTAKLGDGPRHFVLNSNQTFLYVINELKSTITVYNYCPILYSIQTISTIPNNFTSINTGAEILLHPISEKYLYASNRGHDSIAVFTVDNHTGHLSLIQHINVQGRTPRHFNISPNGKYLIVANQDSNNLVVFSIDHTTGKLIPTDSTIQINKPTCIQYLVQS
jgi:6-phosphogluconolactonase